MTSLQIAALAAIIATVLGLCAALALARMKPRMRVPFDVIVYLTLVVPEIVIAVASLIFFVQAQTYVARLPGAGLAGRSCSARWCSTRRCAMLIIRARFVGMGDTLEEAAYDLGLGPLSTFRQVTLPRLLPGDHRRRRCCRSRSRSTTTCSPRSPTAPTNTWPIVLYSAVRFGITPAVNALATIMLGGHRDRDRGDRVLLRRSRVRSGGQESAKSLGSALGLG